MLHRGTGPSEFLSSGPGSALGTADRKSRGERNFQSLLWAPLHSFFKHYKTDSGPQMQLLDVRCGRQMFFLKPAVSLNLFIAVSLLLAPQALPAHCTS